MSGRHEIINGRAQHDGANDCAQQRFPGQAQRGAEPAFAHHAHRHAGRGIGKSQFHRDRQQGFPAKVRQQQRPRAKEHRAADQENGDHRNHHHRRFVGGACGVERAADQVAHAAYATGSVCSRQRIVRTRKIPRRAAAAKVTPAASLQRRHAGGRRTRPAGAAARPAHVQLAPVTPVGTRAGVAQLAHQRTRPEPQHQQITQIPQPQRHQIAQRQRLDAQTHLPMRRAPGDAQRDQPDAHAMQPENMALAQLLLDAAFPQPD